MQDQSLSRTGPSISACASTTINGITKAAQGEPRLGIAYTLNPPTPFCALLMPVPWKPVQREPGAGEPRMQRPGYRGVSDSGMRSELRHDNASDPRHRNEFHAGLQQAFGKYFVIDGEYIWKYTDKAYDFSVLGNTPITFPIEWAKSKIPGYAIHGTMPNFHGLSAFVVMSSVAARFFGPQVAGIGAAPGAISVFRIDHDEFFNQTTHLQYQPWKKAHGSAFNWRYDSGLVAGPAPCAGGNCNNGPNGTDSVVDVSGLTPDQQFEGGLYCGSVHATPTTPISPTGLCPANHVRFHAGINSRRPVPKTTTTILPALLRAICSTLPSGRIIF